MMSRLLLRSMFFTLVALVACRGASDSPEQASDSSAPRSGIQGAWTIAEYNAANGTSAPNPPGGFLFTNTQYSIMYANQPTARSTFADADAPSDQEKLRAFDSFIANSGRYELAGDTLTIHPVISKHPNYMGGGEDRFTYRSAGDTLWLTGIAGAFRWAGGMVSSDTTTAVDRFKLIRAQ